MSTTVEACVERYFTPGKVCNSSVTGLMNSPTPANVHCFTLPGAESIFRIHNTVVRCVQCYYSTRCTGMNQCQTGAAGPTCERCDVPYYYEVGSQCLPCQDIPLPAMCLGGLIVLIGLVIICHGFTASLAVKVRLLWKYTQLIMLTLHIKTAWPSVIPTVVQIFSFSVHSFKLFAPECYFSRETVSLHFFEWTCSMLLPILLCLLYLQADKCVGWWMKHHETREDQKPRHSCHRTRLRRLAFTLMTILYAPVAISSAHTHACSHNVPVELTLNTTRDLYLYDQDVEHIACDDFVFQVFYFAGTLFLVIVNGCGPVFIIFFTLQQRKWEQLETNLMQYGSLYEVYKDRFCFWEAVPLLQKFTIIMMSEIYTLNPVIQLSTHLLISTLYLISLLIGRPYRSCQWKFGLPLNVHTSFDVISSTSVILLQIDGLLHLILPLSITDRLIYLDYTVAGSVPFVLLVWTLLVLSVGLEKKTQLHIDEEPETCNTGNQQETSSAVTSVEVLGKDTPTVTEPGTSSSSVQQVNQLQTKKKILAKKVRALNF